MIRLAATLQPQLAIAIRALNLVYECLFFRIDSILGLNLKRFFIFLVRMRVFLSAF